MNPQTAPAGKKLQPRIQVVLPGIFNGSLPTIRQLSEKALLESPFRGAADLDTVIVFKEFAFGFLAMPERLAKKQILEFRKSLDDRTFALFNACVAKEGQPVNYGVLMNGKRIVCTPKNERVEFCMDGHLRELATQNGFLIDGRICKEAKNGTETIEMNRIVVVSSYTLIVTHLLNDIAAGSRALFINDESNKTIMGSFREGDNWQAQRIGDCYYFCLYESTTQA